MYWFVFEEGLGIAAAAFKTTHTSMPMMRGPWKLENLPVCDLFAPRLVLLPAVLLLFFSNSPRGAIGIIPRRLHRGEKVDGQPGTVVSPHGRQETEPPSHNPGLRQQRQRARFLRSGGGTVLWAPVGGTPGVAPDSPLPGREGRGSSCCPASRTKTLRPGG